MTQPRFADLHQHVLWGLDDGPQTAKQMQAQLKKAHEEGIELIAATCHAYPQIQRFDQALYQERLMEANEYCQNQNWPLKLIQGSEIAYCDSVPDLLRCGMLPAIGETRYVLVEFPCDVSVDGLTKAADRLYQAGYWPIVAHVERFRCLVRSPKQAVMLRDELGLLYQVNCETILRPRGWKERRFLRELTEANAVDLLATDAHNLTQRSIEMRAAYHCVGQQNAELAQRMLANGWKIAAGE